MEVIDHGVTILLLMADISQIEVDVVVNAANNGLWGGGGVDGAIHRAAGPAIAKECQTIRETHGGCPTGQAVMTGAGRLPAKKIVHTVGPVWQGGRNQEERLLADCYRNSLVLARESRMKSIAFPNISTGVYGFPKELAAPIAWTAVRTFLEKENDGIERVLFVCFDRGNYDLYEKLFASASVRPA